MSVNNYLIGNNQNTEKYIESNGNINLLPLENLPLIYYPLNGEQSYDIKNNIKRISSQNKSVDKLNLNKYISILESKDEPYNNNNIIIIIIILLFIWIIIILIILKVIYILLNKKYTAFMITLIILLLSFSIFYSFYITSKNF
jgi:hypothetical protein|tara:strand:+ start:6183 stop:6611 length:429 start_codon:yes stop_codon:yes gene_type:complete